MIEVERKIKLEGVGRACEREGVRVTRVIAVSGTFDPATHSGTLASSTCQLEHYFSVPLVSEHYNSFRLVQCLTCE